MLILLCETSLYFELECFCLCLVNRIVSQAKAEIAWLK